MAIKQRTIFKINDWSGGQNTRDGLLPENMAAYLNGYHVGRKGLLEKTYGRKAYTFDGLNGQPWTKIYDWFHFYMNEEDCLAVLADVGGTVYLSVYDGSAWTHYTEAQVAGTQDGYINDDLEGVEWVLSMVGGIATLRIYPIYPNTTAKNEWICLRIFYKPAINTFEKWGITRLSSHSMSGSSPEFTKGVAVYADGQVHCACNRLDDQATPVRWLKPCVQKNDASVPSIAGCAAIPGGASGTPPDYSAYRTAFDTDFSNGDIVLWDYGFLNGTYLLGCMMAQVLGRITGGDTKGIVMTVPNDAERSAWCQTAGSTHPGHQYKLGSQTETALSAGVKCLKGKHYHTSWTLPSIAEMPEDVQYPSSQITTQYSSVELIEYGLSFELVDGQHSNIVLQQHVMIGDWDNANYALGKTPAPTQGLLLITFSNTIFPTPTVGTGAEKELKDMIKAAHVWRRNAADGEWKHLTAIPRMFFGDPASPETEAKHGYYGGSNLVFTTIPISSGIALFFLGVVDWGQTLADNVFSITGGLEEEDMGVEIGCKAPAVYGRKIYAGNNMILKRWDATHTPEWKDDEVRVSLYDKGESWNAFDYVDVVAGESDEIVKLMFHGRQMAVKKRGRVVFVDVLGYSEGSWKIAGEFRGGIADREYVCNTPYGTVWASEEGLYIWDGRRRITLSEAIEVDWREFYNSATSGIVLGYDVRTDKLFVCAVGASESYVWIMRTGAIQLVPWGWTKFRNDIDGRLIGKDSTNTGAHYPEAKESELSGNEFVITAAQYISGNIDLGSIAQKMKVQFIHVYYSYKRFDNSGTHDINIDHKWDNAAAWVTATHQLSASELEGSAHAMIPVHSDGRVINIRIDPNDVNGDYFEYFRIWRIEITAEERILK